MLIECNSVHDFILIDIQCVKGDVDLKVIKYENISQVENRKNYHKIL